jgi:hypothetical protein
MLLSQRANRTIFFLLKGWRVKIQSFHGQLERIVSGIATGNIHVESATLAVLNVNFMDQKAILAGNIARVRGFKLVINTGLPSWVGNDFTERSDDARSAATNIPVSCVG